MSPNFQIFAHAKWVCLSYIFHVSRNSLTTHQKLTPVTAIFANKLLLPLFFTLDNSLYAYDHWWSLTSHVCTVEVCSAPLCFILRNKLWKCDPAAEIEWLRWLETLGVSDLSVDVAPLADNPRVGGWRWGYINDLQCLRLRHENRSFLLTLSLLQ